jgi:hypothetical protein
VLSIGVFVFGWVSNGSPLWPFLIHRRFQRWVPWGAFFWSFSLLPISTFLLYEILKPQFNINQLLTSPGIFYASIALFLSIYTFLNTLIINRRQREEIGSFSQLLDDLIGKFNEWKNLTSEEKRKKFLYMVAYAPAIGSISEPEKYSQFALDFHPVTHGPIQVKVVCYPNDLIYDFHKKLGVLPTKIISEGRTIQQEVDRMISDLQGERNGVPDAVWRSNKIGPLQLIVTPDVAYQFVVIPEFNGTKNKIMGFRSEDVSVIEFLKQTYFDFESEAITPTCRRIGPEQISLSFNPPQENIKQIDVYISESEQVNVDKIAKPITYSWDKPLEILDEIEISNPRLKDARFLKVVLFKGNGANSKPSKRVSIPEPET